MGITKRMIVEYQERGLGESDKIVCHECVGNYYLKRYIKKNGIRGKCDYCRKMRKSVDLEDLMEPIMKGIGSEYEDATSCMRWDSREGGYIGANTWDNYDLVYDELWNEFEIDDKKLLYDIANLIDDSIVWCPKNPYSLRDYDEDYYTWRSFGNQLKHDIRYVFFMAVPDEIDSYERYNRPSDILDMIGNGISKLGLIATIKKNTPLYRGRMHNRKEIIESATDLGAPPSSYARSSRMNPVGISMFYAAFDELTVLSEIFDNRKYQATIGTFYNQRDLSVIDFSKIPNIIIPSIFDIENRKSRISLLFLRAFYDEITSKVNDDELLNYIPTQVVTEYLRHVYRTNDGRKIDGVIYSSSIRKEGKCIVLFFDNKACSDEKDNIIWLDKSSIKNVKVSSIKIDI